ncbi:hypothetical protein [Sphingopyxis terrae]|uniref:hypothetical protein n=1 Tax=Sphingopyxis terrae TaxID=33052 RepID=UPI0007880525|nr:hypothetical protein [Sphingopyxis terrae]
MHQDLHQSLQQTGNSLFGLQADAEAPQSGHFKVADGVEIESQHMFTPDMIMDGNLGMIFLHDWIITLDLREGRGWIIRNPEARPAPKAALPSKSSP